MLTKIIKGSIPMDKKGSFSYAQQHWAALAHVDGFIGQLGDGMLKMKQIRALLHYGKMKTLTKSL